MESEVFLEWTDYSGGQVFMALHDIMPMAGAHLLCKQLIMSCTVYLSWLIFMLPSCRHSHHQLFLSPACMPQEETGQDPMTRTWNHNISNGSCLVILYLWTRRSMIPWPASGHGTTISQMGNLMLWFHTSGWDRARSHDQGMKAKYLKWAMSSHDFIPLDDTEQDLVTRAWSHNISGGLCCIVISRGLQPRHCQRYKLPYAL